MKTRHVVSTAALALGLVFGLAPLALVRGATTLNATNHYAYAGNLGWLDWRGDSNSGAVIGEYVCSGYIYSANAGWINLGSGSPANQVQYQNNSGTDFGVNQDGLGNLRGYAWGANIGWIHFESIGAPKVDLFTGKMSGYAWSANCGWISVSNGVAVVQTDSIRKGALAANGLPIPWLLQNFGTAIVDPNGDPDHDGASNAEEYLAGTDPNNGGDVLRITRITRETLPGTYTTLSWPGEPTRFYAAQRRSALDPDSSWQEFYTGTSPGASGLGFDLVITPQFFRMRAFRPLTP